MKPKAQEAAANDEKIGEIIASGRPVMRKIPDLLTTPSITGNLNPPEKPEWQKAAEWVVDSARDIWRNLFNEDAQVLKMPIPMPLCSACRRSIW